MPTSLLTGNTLVACTGRKRRNLITDPVSGTVENFVANPTRAERYAN
jgi:hypothetical protein